MVSIFVGSGSGFARGSGSALGGTGLLGSGTQGRSGESVSVNAATGNLLIAREDEFLVGRGPDASISRTYNSLAQMSDGDNGDQWQQSTMRRVFGLTGTLNTAGSTVSRQGGDGSVIVYAWDAAKSAYVTTDGDGAHDRLVKSGATWIWTDGSSQWTETYEASVADAAVFRIKEQKDTDGYKLSFTYVAATDKLDRVTTANHGAGNAATGVPEQSYVKYIWDSLKPDNLIGLETYYTDYGDPSTAADDVPAMLTRTRYAYDASNRLITVTVDLSPGDNSVADGKTYVTNYTYDGTSDRIASITQTDGSSLAITYDTSGRVKTLTQAVAAGDTRVTTLTYGTGYTMIAGPDGQTTRLDYDAAAQLTKITAPPATTTATAQNVQFGYDGSGNLTSVTDSAGKVTVYTYDGNGNMLTSKDANNNLVTRTYGTKNELLTETRTGSDTGGAAVSHTTRYVYDIENHLRYVISAEGEVVQYYYNVFGQMYWQNAFPESHYDLTGLAASDAPTEAQMDLWRDAAAGPAGTARTSVMIQHLTFNGRGQITLARGYGASSAWTNAVGSDGTSVGTFTYDQSGRLLSRYDQGENAETFVYDGLGRLVGSTDLAGGVTTYRFDDANTTTLIQLSTGKTQTRIYNKAGDLIGEIESQNFQNAGTTNYANAQTLGNWVLGGIASAAAGTINGQPAFSYTVAGAASGQSQQVISPGISVAANEVVTSTVTFQGTATSTSLAFGIYGSATGWGNADIDLGSARIVSGPGVIEKAWNSEGFFFVTGLSATEPTVIEVQRRFTQAQGVATRFYPDYPNGSIQGNAIIAAAPSMTKSPASETSYLYDKNGRLRAATDATGNNSFILYDNAGRKTADIAADGGVIEYRYDAAARLATTIAYATKLDATKMGDLATAGGIAETAGYRPGATASDIWSWSVYDAGGRLIESIDGTGGVAVFSYDGSDRLIKTVSYFYKLTAGQLTTLKATPPTATLLPVLDAARDAVSRSFYDADGQLIGTLDGEGYLSEIVYDAAGQKIDAIAYVAKTSSSLWAAGTFAALRTNAGGATAAANRHMRYVYDAQGLLRYTVDNTGHVSSFAYNAAGKLVSTIVHAAPIAAATSDFTYDNIKVLLTGIANSANDRLGSNVYNAKGQVAYTVGAIGTVTGYAYDVAGHVIRTITYATTRAVADLVTMDSWAMGQAANAGNRVARSWYAASGDLRFTVDAEGYVTRFDYDAEGRMIAERRPPNKVTAADTTTIAQIDTLANAAGTAVVTSYSYDAAGRIEYVTDGEGYQTRNVWAANGNLTSVYAAWGTAVESETRYAYDGAGRVLSETRGYGAAEASTVSYAYDGLGNRVSMTDARSKVTTYSYDERGLLLTAVNAAGTTSYEYNGFGDVVKMTDPRGQTTGKSTYYYYDDLGQVTLVRDTESYVTETSYTAFGEVASLTRRYNRTASAVSTTTLPTVAAHASDTVTQYVYDKRGLVLTRIDAENIATTSAYNATGDLLSVTRAGAITAFQYDKRGLVTKTTDAEGFFESYGYDAYGNRTSVTAKSKDAAKVAGGTTTYTYDKRGLLLTETLPFASYTSNGNVQAATVTNTYSYDARGNRTQMVEAAGLTEARTTTYEYDGLNRLTRTSGQARSVLDQSDHVTVTTNFVPTETIAYDAAGNVTSVTDAAGGRNVYYYDDLGRKTVAIDAAGTYTRYVYDKNGNVTETRVYETKVTVPATDGGTPPPANGASRATSFTYDNLNRLLTSSVAGAKTGSYVIGGYAGDVWTGVTTTIATTYEYDAIGNVVKAIDANGNATFSRYDRLGRKTHQLDTEKYLTAWTYDAEGNVLTEKRYATNGNRLFNPRFNGTDGWGIGYDPNGIAQGAPFTGPWYGQDGIKINVNATAAEQVVSLRSDIGHMIPVTAGEKLAIEASVQGEGSIGRVELTMHFFDASGAYIGAVNAATLYGNQAFGTKMTGVIDVPTGAVSMMYELYGFSSGAGAGGLALLEPSLSAISGAQPVASNTADRTTTYTYDKNGNRLTETRAGVAVHDGSGGVTAPQSVTVSWVYNGLGQVVQKNEATDGAARGQVGDESIYYTYDAGGRLLNEERAAFATNYNDVVVTPTVDYRYTGLGDLTYTWQKGQADTAATETRYTYGAGGLLASMTDATGVVHTYSYDRNGTLIRDEYNRANSAGTNMLNAVLTKVDALGRTIEQSVAAWNGSAWAKGDIATTEYNAFGEVSSTGINGLLQTQNKYDLAGRLTATNAGDGVWKLFGYDKNGNQTLAITSAGYDLKNKTFDQAFAEIASATNGAKVNATYTVYDKRGMATDVVEEGRQLTGTSDSQRLTTSRSYNAFGDVLTETDARGGLTSYTYNNIGKLTRKEGPTVEVTYENGGTQWIKPATDYYYDRAGRLVAWRDANGEYAAGGTSGGGASKLADKGNLTRLTLLAGSGYNGSEALVTSETHADGGTRYIKYDIRGDARITIDEVNRWSHRDFDARGLVTVEYRPGGLLDYYAYDSLGQRIRHWNNAPEMAGDVETIDYDTQGRVTATRSFGGDTTSTTYTWDATIAAAGMGVITGGWAENTTMANGRILNEKSDIFGRATWKSDLGNHITTWAYDAAGRQTSSVMDGNTATFTYYNSALIATNSGPNGTATYTYDKAGNRLTEQLKVGVVTIKNQSATYDALGRLTGWNEAGTAKSPAASTTNSYDANGNIRMTHSEYQTIGATGIASGTMTSTDYWYRYDSLNRLVTDRGMLSGTAGAAGTTIVRRKIEEDQGAAGSARSQDIAYDQAGQRQSVTTTYHWREAIADDGPKIIYLNHNETHVESYAYDDAGRLTSVNKAIDGAAAQLKSSLSYDLMGRLTQQQDYGGLGGGTYTGVSYSRSIVYNAKGQVTSDDVSSAREQVAAGAWDTFRSVTTYGYGSGTGYALGSVVTQSAVNTKLAPGSSSWTSQPGTLTTTAYAWYDGAVQDLVTYDYDTGSGSNPIYQTDLLLNGFGQMTGADVDDGVAKDVVYTLDENGQIIRRDESRTGAPSEAAPHEVFYRFAGQQMGMAGNNGTADVSYSQSIADRAAVRPATSSSTAGLFRNGTKTGNAAYANFAGSYDPYNSGYQGSAGGAYTVRAGDTLASIAAQLWGDANLWYKLAAANGMGANSALTEGQSLTIPVGVTRNSHSADTFKPYDPTDALGDLSPTTPKPPKKPKCGMLGQILVAAIAIGVAAWLGPQMIQAAQGALGALGGAIAGGAAAGAVASAASQGVGIAIGAQSGFSWKSVGMAAIAGGIGGGLSELGKAAGAAGSVSDKITNISKAASGGFGSAVLRGALSSALTQGIGVATGLQSKFDFAGVAAAGIGAATGYGMRTAMDGRWSYGGADFHAPLSSLDRLAQGAASNAATAIAAAATRSAISGDSFGDSLMRALPDVIGNTLYESTVAGLASVTASGSRLTRLAQNNIIFDGGIPIAGDPEIDPAIVANGRRMSFFEKLEFDVSASYDNLKSSFVGLYRESRLVRALTPPQLVATAIAADYVVSGRIGEDARGFSNWAGQQVSGLRQDYIGFSRALKSRAAPGQWASIAAIDFGAGIALGALDMAGALPGAVANPLDTAGGVVGSVMGGAAALTDAALIPDSRGGHMVQQAAANLRAMDTTQWNVASGELALGLVGGSAAAKVALRGAPGVVGAAETTGSRIIYDAPIGPVRPHKNSLDYVGDTHVYIIRGPDGSLHKVGESAQGVRVRDGASIRAEQQARALQRETGEFYTTEIRKNFTSKADARAYETRFIQTYERLYGKRPPGNPLDR
ncbi:YD repeat-containing protein [Sphingopyxis panaciterrae]|uniref:LysM peptidoglycan-binding domain-containing protein n=1 Tax=Sphingopyxis panaciterrae TaxID=363841 RepID=UPI001421021D|nr:LysM peptidoglycan-binding domain-containing protein [Sphingopyxis panaciterrae]NIJ36979.1 YD repeat-containing protein [Sphingopyxis panaciterrae]